VLGFLRGAGTSEALLSNFRRQLAEDSRSVSKYKIVRSVLGRLNEQRDGGLAVRREVIRNGRPRCKSRSRFCVMAGTAASVTTFGSGRISDVVENRALQKAAAGLSLRF
jgi:hypothetical protein